MPLKRERLITQPEPQPIEGAKADATRSRILDAALGIFSRKGYHDTRMDDIVTEAGNSKGAIYFHFPNKEHLFLALVDQFANLLERRIEDAIADENAGMDRVRVALEVCLDTFGKYRHPAKLLLVQAVGLGVAFEARRNAGYARFARLIAHHLDEAIALKHIPPVDSEVISWAWMGAIYALVIRWVTEGEPKPKRIIESLVPALLRSVGG